MPNSIFLSFSLNIYTGLSIFCEKLVCSSSLAIYNIPNSFLCLHVCLNNHITLSRSLSLAISLFSLSLPIHPILLINVLWAEKYFAGLAVKTHTLHVFYRDLSAGAKGERVIDWGRARGSVLQSAKLSAVSISHPPYHANSWSEHQLYFAALSYQF